MTPEQVIERVRAITGCAGDDEAAHGLEDALHLDVLAAIAEGAPYAAELAMQALATQRIRFSRWCA